MIRPFVVAFAAVLAVSAPALAVETLPPPAQALEAWKAMTAEQRQSYREQLRAEVQKLPKEERQALFGHRRHGGWMAKHGMFGQNETQPKTQPQAQPQGN